jgi:hypothetical protein
MNDSRLILADDNGRIAALLCAVTCVCHTSHFGLSCTTARLSFFNTSKNLFMLISGFDVAIKGGGLGSGCRMEETLLSVRTKLQV